MNVLENKRLSQLFKSFSNEKLLIPSIQIEVTKDGRHRISTNISKKNVFFESKTNLVPDATAFACAFLFPALKSNAHLIIEGKVHAHWLQNVDTISNYANNWWGFPTPNITAHTKEASSPPNNAALFFTGGVDSFYSLLNTPRKLCALIFIEGYDVPIKDRNRLMKVRSRLSNIASIKKVELITIRTNIREHKYFNRVGWPITHGAALAAAGYCLSNHFRYFYIASTDVTGPHGSHPELDNKWSSGQIFFINHGVDKSRLEKVAAIVQDDLVAQHLRVCWQNTSEDLNCGVCEKCVRTQFQIFCAKPDFFQHQNCFPKSDPKNLLSNIKIIPSHLKKQWNDICKNIGDQKLKRSIQSILHNN